MWINIEIEYVSTKKINDSSIWSLKDIEYDDSWKYNLIDFKVEIGTEFNWKINQEFEFEAGYFHH